MEFVAVGWCTVMQLKLDEVIRNLTCSDLEIPLLVIGLGITELKKTRFVYLLDIFLGKGGEGVV